MKRIVTANEMRECERAAFEIGLNEDMLIENAAAAMCEVAEKEISKRDKIEVAAGGGNNGADGLSLARMLLLKGYRADVVTVADKRNAAVEARLSAFEAAGGRTLTLDGFERRADLYDVIVDAVFGIGLNRNVEGEQERAIKIINAAEAKKLAVDIPSGLCADSGKALGEAVKADLTVTFGAYKYGHFLGGGADFCGKTVLRNIGIPVNRGAYLCEKDNPLLPRRLKSGHKGDYGRVFVIGGCKEMTGAPQLCAMSALENGAGLVTLCAAASLETAFYGRVKEAMLRLLPDTNGFIAFDEKELRRISEKADAIVLGMGMGANEDLPRIIGYFCESFDGTLVLDADALNALKDKTQLLIGHKCKLVLTPHRGEFFRLFGECGESEIAEKTKSAARRLNAVIVNKSDVTIITDGEEVYLNAAGSPAMAKGGSGDALAGAIGALSCRLGSLAGAAAACYIMGKAGEAAEKRLGENAVLSSDVIAAIKRR